MFTRALVFIAILGAWRARRDAGRNSIVTTPVEHKAVLESIHQAAREGAEERTCEMTPDGVVDVASFTTLADDRAAIASVMWVNNEIGTVQPVPQLAERAKAAAFSQVGLAAVHPVLTLILVVQPRPIELLELMDDRLAVGLPSWIGGRGFTVDVPLRARFPSLRAGRCASCRSSVRADGRDP